jgi:hypothetical protein
MIMNCERVIKEVEEKDLDGLVTLVKAPFYRIQSLTALPFPTLKELAIGKPEYGKDDFDSMPDAYTRSFPWCYTEREVLVINVTPKQQIKCRVGDELGPGMCDYIQNLLAQAAANLEEKEAWTAEKWFGTLRLNVTPVVLGAKTAKAK